MSKILYEPCLVYSNHINFIGRECLNFEVDGWKYRDIVVLISEEGQPEN